jgi:hypothetical protein
MPAGAMRLALPFFLPRSSGIYGPPAPGLLFVLAVHVRVRRNSLQLRALCGTTMRRAARAQIRGIRAYLKAASRHRLTVRRHYRPPFAI